MKNRVEVDLVGVTNKETLLHKLGEFFEFGGPGENHPVTQDGTGWGMNWDGLEDALCTLDIGGIWERGKRFEFPLEIIFLHSGDFKEQDPESFALFQKIIAECITEYAESEKILAVRFE